MRIMSFREKWDKLNQPEFTTFRYPRCDTDWYEGEVIQVFYKSRSPMREKLGIAQIIKKEQRELDPNFEYVAPVITHDEAVADGFLSRGDMVMFMQKQYGLDYISLFNKLTLRWVIPTKEENKRDDM